MRADVAGVSDDPLNLLHRMLEPKGLAEFVATDFTQQFVHIRGEEHKFAGLVDWPQVNRALESHRLQAPRLQLVRGGKAVPAERYTRQVAGTSHIDAGRVMALLDKGVTLAFSYADEVFPAVARLADMVAEGFNAHVNANLYAGWRRESGFDLHWDRHEVFVLQVSGRKHWRIHRPTREAPHGRDPMQPPVPEGAPAFDAVIEAGDLIYIPRGWWHNATPLDEPSLHLTLAVVMPDAQHLMDWFGARLLQLPVGRRDVPTWGSGSRQQQFHDDLLAAIGDLPLTEFLESWRAGRRARPRFTLPGFPRPRAGKVVPSTRVRLANQRGLATATHPMTGEVAVDTYERSWPCSVAVGAALARLSSSVDVEVAELASDLGEQEERELIGLLEQLMLVGELYCDIADENE